ncbi:MAG: hypothetical protein HQK96_19710 [Nitrospirae bacterium]|nr:hypothetical protein [Nitrospirota bacterium]
MKNDKAYKLWLSLFYIKLVETILSLAKNREATLKYRSVSVFSASHNIRQAQE